MKNIRSCFLPTFLIFFVAANISAQSTTQILFLGVQWGQSKNIISQIMTEKGFLFSREDDENTLIFKGPLAGGSADISCEFYKDRLFKVYVELNTYIQVEDIANVFIEKYGVPEYLDEGRFYGWKNNELGEFTIHDVAGISLKYIDGVIIREKIKDDLRVF